VFQRQAACFSFLCAFEVGFSIRIGVSPLCRSPTTLMFAPLPPRFDRSPHSSGFSRFAPLMKFLCAELFPFTCLIAPIQRLIATIRPSFLYPYDKNVPEEGQSSRQWFSVNGKRGTNESFPDPGKIRSYSLTSSGDEVAARFPRCLQLNTCLFRHNSQHLVPRCTWETILFSLTFTLKPYFPAIPARNSV